MGELEQLGISLLRVGNNPSTGVLLSPSLSLTGRPLLLLIVVQSLRRHISRLVAGLISLPALGFPSRRRPPTQFSSTFLPLFIAVLMSRLVGYLRRGTLFLARPTHPRLVLCLIPLQLSSTQQLMNLAVSEDLDLLIRQGALHPVGVVAQVVIFGFERVVVVDGCC